MCCDIVGEGTCPGLLRHPLSDCCCQSVQVRETGEEKRPAAGAVNLQGDFHGGNCFHEPVDQHKLLSPFPEI